MFWELLIRYSSLDRQLEINLSFFFFFFFSAKVQDNDIATEKCFPIALQMAGFTLQLLCVMAILKVVCLGKIRQQRS